MKFMHAFITVLIIILMLATVGVLFAGMINMIRNEDPVRSNQLMRWRVILQASAVAIFVVLMMLLRS
jgi:hypothetical protein